RRKVLSTFERNGLKGPKPSLITGNIAELFSVANPNIIFDKWIAKYGDVFGYFIGAQPVLFVNDIDLIQQIFITRSSSFRNRLTPANDFKPMSEAQGIIIANIPNCE
ncbi:cytochrome P450-like protein 17, partial [Dinothrombium tinctorium]